MVDWKDPKSILRTVEMVLALVILGIVAGDYCGYNSLEKALFVDGMTVAYVIISVAAFIALLLEETLGLRTFALMALIGGVAYLVIGVLLVHAGSQNNCRMSVMFAGGLSLAEAVAYIIDFVFIYRSL